MKEDKYERIAARAYAIWEREGKPAGHDVEHWLKAERELAQEREMSEPAAATSQQKARSSAIKAPPTKPKANGMPKSLRT